MWMLPFADEPKPQEPEILDDDPMIEEEESVGDEVSKTLMVLLPWSISILFHLAIILLVFFLGWVLIVEEEEEEVVIAAPTLSPLPPTPVQNQMESVEPSERSRRTPKLVSKPEVDAVEAISIDQNLLAFAAPPSSVDVLDEGESTQEFMGVQQATGEMPTKIAFVIDASGSLIDTFPFVLEELKSFVRGLQPKQRFTIIFYQGNKVVEVPPRGLQKALSDQKQRVIDWIDPASNNIVPRGSGNPIEAIRTALNYQPQLIYLLSDNITGREQYAISTQRLINEIREANRNNTMISTIQFIYEDPLALTPDETGRVLGEQGRTLWKISDMTGGMHTFVHASELNIR